MARKKNEEHVEELKLWLGRKHGYELLNSELVGFYDEMDKLCKKAPKEPVTNLQLKIMNKLIERAKALLFGDEIISEIASFVAAGDPPEYRDAVTVLRQIKQGLIRFSQENEYLWRRAFEEECDQYNLTDLDAIDVFNPNLKDQDDGAAE